MFDCKTYARDFFSAMALYLVCVFGSVWLLDNTAIAGIARVIVALSPILPVVIAAIIVLAHFRRLDEMEARIQLEGFTTAAIFTGILSCSMDFVENAGLPTLSLSFVFPVMLALWPLCSWLVKRRYS